VTTTNAQTDPLQLGWRQTEQVPARLDVAGTLGRVLAQPRVDQPVGERLRAPLAKLLKRRPGGHVCLMLHDKHQAGCTHLSGSWPREAASRDQARQRGATTVCRLCASRRSAAPSSSRFASCDVLFFSLRAKSRQSHQRNCSASHPATTLR